MDESTQGLEPVEAKNKRVQATAKLAIHLAIRGEMDIASALINEEINWGDPQEAVAALAYWADVVIAAERKHQGAGPPEPGRPVVLEFRNADTGETGTTDEVPAEWVWAGRWVAARAADDKDMLWALWRTLIEGEAQFILDAVSATANMAMMHVRRARGEAVL